MAHILDFIDYDYWKTLSRTEDFNVNDRCWFQVQPFFGFWGDTFDLAQTKFGMKQSAKS